VINNSKIARQKYSEELAFEWVNTNSPVRKRNIEVRLIRNMEPLVKTVVYRLKTGDPMGDQELQNDLRLAVIERLESFDPKKGRFETHLYWGWRAKKDRHFRSRKLINGRFFDDVEKVMVKDGEVEITMGKERSKPRFEGITFSNGEEKEIMGAKGPGSFWGEDILLKLKQKAIITGTELNILDKYFNEGVTMPKIAEDAGVSATHIGNIKNEAIRKIKKYIRTNPDKVV